MNRLALMVTLCVAVFTVACGGSGSVPIPPPPTGGFSNTSLKGLYAFSMSGTDAATGEFFARVGSFSADGNGGVQRKFARERESRLVRAPASARTIPAIPVATTGSASAFQPAL